MSIQTNMSNYAGRRLVDRLMRGLTYLATAAAILPLLLIIGYVVIVGGSALNVEFFTQTYLPPVAADLGGGIDPITGLPADFAGIDAVTAPAAESAQAGEPDLSQVQARGGVLHGIVGTMMITFTALLLALPIGIMAGIFLAEYPDTPFSTFIRFCSDVLGVNLLVRVVTSRIRGA